MAQRRDKQDWSKWQTGTSQNNSCKRETDMDESGYVLWCSVRTLISVGGTLLVPAAAV